LVMRDGGFGRAPLGPRPPLLMSSSMPVVWKWIPFVIILIVSCASAALNASSSENQLLPGNVRLAVIAPSDPQHEQCLSRILPSIELAVSRVRDPVNGVLPSWKIDVDYRDSKCSSTYGPLAAFEFHINKSAGDITFMFIGFLL